MEKLTSSWHKLLALGLVRRSTTAACRNCRKGHFVDIDRGTELVWWLLQLAEP